MLEQYESSNQQSPQRKLSQEELQIIEDNAIRRAERDEHLQRLQDSTPITLTEAQQARLREIAHMMFGDETDQ